MADKMKRLLSENFGSAQMIGTVIAGLVAIIVGVMIWYRINTAMFESAGLPVRAFGAGVSSTASNATRAAQTAVWNSTNASANTVWTLFPIVAIVVVAGVILAIVMGFGRAQQ
jgi:uncharacterized protein (UPF0333 family)